jgi:hypothetical protein
VHEEIFYILSHKENASQNDTEIPSHPSQNGYYQENKQQINAGEVAGGGKEGPLNTIDGSAN